MAVLFRLMREVGDGLDMWVRSVSDLERLTSGAHMAAGVRRKEVGLRGCCWAAAMLG